MRTKLLLIPICAAAAGSAHSQFFEDDVQVLWTADAETNNDQYAWQCEAIGDIHGDDGISEIVVTAPFSDLGRVVNRGRAYVYDGCDGTLLHMHQGDITNGCLGFRVYRGADFTGDGVPDYIITQAGAQGNTRPDQSGGAFPGYINVYSGADHSLVLRIDGPTPEGRLGIAAAVLDDITGDGVPEILGGAPQANANGNTSGAAYVFDGVSGLPIRTHFGPEANALFGNGIASIEDITGDGVRDYAIGSFGEGENRRGRVRVYDAASGDELYMINPLDYPAGEHAVDFSRFFMFDAGDIDGDGRSDLYVADWFDREGGITAGKVWVFDTAIPEPGTPSRVVQTVVGTIQQEWLGFGRGFPDVDGDGAGELLVCSYGFRTFSGALGLYSGKTGERLRFISRSANGEQFGYDACSPGDLNGDGIPDIVVTEAGTLQAGDRGRIWAIAGQNHTPCHADVNGDGDLTSADFTAWINAFNNSLPGCDQNGDNKCTPTDFTAWVANFSAGGC